MIKKSALGIAEDSGRDAAASDEEWVSWGAATDEEWAARVKRDFGLDIQL